MLGSKISKKDLIEDLRKIEEREIEFIEPITKESLSKATRELGRMLQSRSYLSLIVVKHK